MRALKSLPNIKEVLISQPTQVEDLFISKLIPCGVIFNFSNDNNSYLEEKDIKRKTLLELIQFFELPVSQR